MRTNLLWPRAFDVGEDGAHLVFAEDALVGGHGVGGGARHGRTAVQGHGDEVLVGVVPGVAAGVVGRGRIAAVGQGCLPVGLAFEVDAVADGAVAGVEGLAGDHRVGARELGVALGGGAPSDQIEGH